MRGDIEAEATGRPPGEQVGDGGLVEKLGAEAVEYDQAARWARFDRNEASASRALYA